MKAIILAGGRGRRLSPLTLKTPKCLLSCGSYTPIERLVSQLDFCSEIVVVVSYLGKKIIKRLANYDNISFITKTEYKTNANRYSLLLALKKLRKSDEDICVFESDMIAEDDLITYVTGTDFEERSTWFVSGKLEKEMYGGIIKTDGHNKITKIEVLKEGSLPDYTNYYKMMGILRFNKKDIESFYNSLFACCKLKGYTGYYLDAFNRTLYRKPLYMGDASHYLYKTFNTIQEYHDAKCTNFNIPTVEKKVEEVPIEEVLPIEDHKPKRFGNIDCSEPIRIEKNHNLILDGHHRYHLLKENGAKTIKVIRFDYSEVDMWSLREEIKINKEDVIGKVLNGWTFQYKTVKHKFPKVVMV